MIKKLCDSVIRGRGTYLLLGFLIALARTANAQQFRSGVVGGVTVSGGGQGIGFTQHFEGSGPQQGFSIVINGQGDVGASLLKICDTNQDGGAALIEVKAALVDWFPKADSDTNGALSVIELATALKEFFPVPQPPPGLPAPPEEFGIHNLLAKKFMAAIDTNKDGGLTFKEAIAFIDQNFPQWDADSSGWLDSAEFSAAIAPFLVPDPSDGGVVQFGFGGPGPGTVRVR